MNRDMPLEELIAQLRRAAATWFKNSDLLLLEELIRRVKAPQRIIDDGHDRTGFPHMQLARHRCIHPDCQPKERPYTEADAIADKAHGFTNKGPRM